MWTVREFEREKTATGLATALELDPAQIRRFDKSVVSWISSYGETMSRRPFDTSNLPGLGETPADHDLAGALDQLGPGSARLYAWSRLLKAQDALLGFGFGWSITGPLLSNHLARVAPGDPEPGQVAAVIEYITSDMVDSPNSGAYGALWDLASRGELLATADYRQQILGAFLRLIQRRSFHRDFKQLERVLRATHDADEDLHRQLREFWPANQQGAAIVACHVLRLLPVESAASATHAADVLAWLVDARRKEPTQRWAERRGQLEEAVGTSTLRDVCAEVARHPDYARHIGTGWRDELFWFMWKSSAWYRGEAPRRILGSVSAATDGK